MWGRSLCINESTLQGAMFDCIRRAQELGWAVVVANPADGKPAERHLHLTSLWRKLLAASAAQQRLLVIAHSYGAPAATLTLTITITLTLTLTLTPTLTLTLTLTRRSGGGAPAENGAGGAQLPGSAGAHGRMALRRHLAAAGGLHSK